MRKIVKLFGKLALFAICGLGVSYAIAISTPYWFKRQAEAHVDVTDASLI